MNNDQVSVHALNDDYVSANLFILFYLSYYYIIFFTLDSLNNDQVSVHALNDNYVSANLLFILFLFILLYFSHLIIAEQWSSLSACAEWWLCLSEYSIEINVNLFIYYYFN